jgi:hypothetical protein
MTKPKNDYEWALERAHLHCKIGKDAIKGKIPDNVYVCGMEYALYNLLDAVNEITIALRAKND